MGIVRQTQYRRPIPFRPEYQWLRGRPSRSVLCRIFLVARPGVSEQHGCHNFQGRHSSALHQHEKPLKRVMGAYFVAFEDYMAWRDVEPEYTLGWRISRRTEERMEYRERTPLL